MNNHAEEGIFMQSFVIPIISIALSIVNIYISLAIYRAFRHNITAKIDQSTIYKEGSSDVINKAVEISSDLIYIDTSDEFEYWREVNDKRSRFL